MKTLIIISVLILLFIFISIDTEENEYGYTAEFGDPDEHLSRFNLGFNVTGNKAITRELSYTNVSIFGQTGSGKTSTVILGSVRSLARGKSSMVINDVSSEVFDRTWHYLAKRGYKIIIIDWANPKISACFNPILFCNTISDIQKLSLIIIRNTIGVSGSDPFWEQSAMMVLSLIIRYLRFHTEEQYQTVQNVLRMVEQMAVDEKEQKVDKLFLKTKDEELISAYKATIAMSSKTFQSVIATLRTALGMWADKEVCRTTAMNTINFDSLRKEPTVIYLKTPLKDLQYYKPISALFLNTLFDYTLSRIPSDNERSLFYILEEFAVFKFPGIESLISNIRKHKSGLFLCQQDEMSLVSNYGQAAAHNIVANCGTSIFLKGQPLNTCQKLSQLLGKYTYKHPETGAERVRELMTPDEIRKSEKALIFINNQAPLLCSMKPYYDNLFVSHKMKKVAYKYDALELTEPALLPLS